VAEKLGRMAQAEEYLRKLIALRPQHAHAYNALGYSLTDRGERLDEALALLTEALRLAPDDPFILDSMGWLMFRRGDAPAALTYLARAFAERPDPEIAAHYGEVLWAAGKQDEAQRIWAEATQAHPANEVLAQTIKRFQP
jgi:tetratricopeptide (TPR) repeat protein